ncbi:MATE family efflux transporter [Clostridium estertheticum]|uniref:MATE family efflux transporter n=1 Tax=Clostridium estertheticum TaxID=238834 RepID=UPI001CF1376F|nr:MATE family efflux transporter [Clostridium estertheticum]MCB2308437.1 MATE family efflux transporter [Clostridium estertheticum]MCB2347423.1 MATE family efflux transporter [Clostridium estertheticum]MCB2352045.1 MATE family efflux transporter [Clostridium estertheticum]WAG44425.1 MATE family efflux transporter [Clostridium estertheticum]
MLKINEIETESVKKLLFKFSIPSIIAMLANALYNICDRIFVGIGVGVLGISAISISYTVTLAIMGFSMLVGLGATSLVSIKLGEHNIEKCEIIVGNTFTLSFIVSIILMILGYCFLTPMLSIFGASGKVLEYAKIYTGILLIGTPFQILSYSMNNILKGQGKAKRAMINFLISIILNVIFNPLFIFVFHLGIAGSALATILSTAIGTIFSTSPYFLKNASIKIRYKNLKLRKDIISSSLSIGVSGFVMQLSMSLITILFNKQCLYYGGNIAVAAYGIINSLIMLIYMPIYGINQGVQPIIGYNYGAKKYDRVRDSLKLSIKASSIISSIGFIIFQLFSKNIFILFGKNSSQLIAIGTPAMKIFSISTPIIGFVIIGLSYFQYIGKAGYSIVLSLLRQIVIIVPLTIILPRFMGINGIWVSTPITDFIVTVIMLILICPEIKRLNVKMTGTL